MRKITSMAALLAASLTVAQAQTTTIADWTFDNYPSASGVIIANPAPSTGTGTVSALGMNNSYNSTTSISSPDIIADVAGSSGGGLNDWRVRGQTPGNGWSTQAAIGTQGAEFNVSTVGYSAITLTFDISTTKQAEANLQVLFTTDGTTWNNATITYAGANTASVLNNTTSANTVVGSYLQMKDSNGGWYDGITANFSGISAANNNPNFGVEIVNASMGADDINQAGTTYNNNSGNWRYDNVSIQGVPEPSTLALAALGLTSVFFFGRRQQRKA